MSIQVNRNYVILKHTGPDDIHWDFMLESEDLLSTWRISIPPAELSNTATTAEKIFDHSKKFLTYRGPVNKGKSNVTIADKGTYSIISENKDQLQIRIKAKILNRKFSLIKRPENTWEITPL